MVKICTYNVQGLRDENKRVKVFKQLQASNYAIIALQETHCTADVLDLWKSQWDGPSVWTVGKSNREGVAFLFSKKHTVNIHDEYEEFPGRILRLTITFDDHPFQLLNLYGPNSTSRKTNESFYYRADQTLSFDPPPIIFGDFNMVEDISMDRQGGNTKPYHSYGSANLSELKENCEVTDIWRHIHPNKKEFTWMNYDGSIKSRIDRIYVCNDLINFTSKALIIPSLYSDHNILVVQLDFPDLIERGGGYWKLNVENLKDDFLKNKVNVFWKDWKTKKLDFDNILTWYDMGKLYVKSIIVQYTSHIQKEIYIRKCDLQELIRQQQLLDTPDLEKIFDLKEELKEIEDEKNKKIFILTQTAICESGEKPTKYFYKLLKKRKKANTISCLVTDDDKLLTSEIDKVNHAKDFYKNLYTKTQDISQDQQNFFLNKVSRKLSAKQKADLDSPLKLEELSKALWEAKKGKVPSHDGFPAEFYLTFWDVMKHDILEVAHYCMYTAHILPESHRRSYIILLYKKGARDRLANWRPISLLCADFKIISKALSTRLKYVLSTVLHNSQTASVLGRSMFHNWFLIRDTVEYCNRFGINAYLVSIDQEKAFDKVNRDFLYKIMEKMNFGKTFINCIRTIYNSLSAHVLVNGFISVAFELERCLRQGGSLSSQLYGIYLEPVAQAVRDDSQIKGIPVPGGEDNIASHFTDDALFLLLAETRLSALFNVFERFRQATGSTINRDKTEGIYIGKPNTSDPCFYNILWKNIIGGMKVLGIYVFDNFQKIQHENWKVIIKSVTDEVQNLEQRALSFKGKVLLLNTVTLSKLWNLATVIPMTHDHETQIKKATFKYLWKSDYNLIANETAYQPKTKGGLGIKSPLLQQMALQLKFFKNITDSSDRSNWLTLPRYWLGYHLAPLNPEWAFLRSNLVPKLDTPMYTISMGFTTKQKRPNFYESLFAQLLMIDVKSCTWSTPHIYQDFLLKRYKPPKAYIEHWSFHTYDSGDIWRFVYLTHSEGRHQDVHFRYLHIKLPTLYLIKKNHEKAGKDTFNMNVACIHCPTKVENQYHVIHQCVQAKPLWDYVYPNITEILKTHSYKLPDLICGKFPKGISDFKKRMVLTIIQITMHCIWLNRNSFTHEDDVLPTLEGSRNIIKNTFHKVILTKLREFEPHNIDKFIKIYCHTPRVVRIDLDRDILITKIIKRR